MRPLTFSVIFLLLTISVNAQGLKDALKKTATDVGRKLNTKENWDKAGNIAQGHLSKARAEFDSTDFDYAVLVSDNSGLLDIKEKGERGSKVNLAASNFISFAQKNELEPVQEARFQLEMGEMQYAAYKLKAAEKSFAVAKKIFEEKNLTEELGYIKTIANHGLLYATMGRFTQAEGFTAEALEMRRTKFGENNIGIAASLNNYGVLKYNQARYNEAEKDFTDAIAVMNFNKVQGSMQYAILLNNQAILFQSIGRFEDAEVALKEACAIGEKLKTNKSTNHLKFWSNLALLYQQTKKYPEAEAIYTTMEKKLGKTNPDYASMLNNQAGLYLVMGKEDKVEELLKKAIGIYKSSFGEENPAYAKAISDLGNFYRFKERYKEADAHLERALAVREITFGRNHPLYVQSQEDLAILNWKQKSWSKAYMMYRDVMDKSLDFINKYFPPMSEAEKTKYLDVLSPRFQRFYNFCLDAHLENPAIVQDFFDFQIATKALLLNSTNKVKSLIFDSKDPLLIKDYIIWLDQKETLARLYSYSKDELKTQNINLDSMVRAANSMERKLSERSADFSSGYSSAKIGFTDIQKVMADNEAIVEIIRLHTYTQKFENDAKYVALILTKTAEKPKLVLLDNGTQLETRNAKYYRNMIQQRMPDELSYEQYWARIESELGAKKVIYLSPDGVYNQININTLKKPQGDYVVNRFDVVILGNSKDLIGIKGKKTRTPRKSAGLLGFPDYGGSELSPLPGTKVEIESVSRILKVSGYQLSQFTQKTASEANLKSIKSPALLHIATHGYFLQDVETSGSVFGVNMENANNNPLLRSGLMLAGASATISGKRSPSLQSNDNGILTAYEAMNLNLNATDLVVLSACETGLGDVKSGEGVYGLQRAFLVAGADALIMSLWKVDDEATQLLMTNFYSNWIKLGNKQKAFKQAQIQLLAKYKDPYFWGAFVMMGL
jgi:CHAT domain-containing protein/tetratricopeptide (TPR) repeat protein